MSVPAATLNPWRRLRDRSGRPWSLEAQIAVAVFGALLLFSLASFVYLTETSYATWASDRIKEQQQETEILEWQEAELLREIADLTSPAVLAPRVEALGYRPPKETIFITPDNNRPVPADNQSLIMPSTETTEGLAESQEQLAGWLEENVFGPVAQWRRIMTR